MNYISIKAVVSRLAGMLPASDFDADQMLEWAYIGKDKLQYNGDLEPHLAFISVDNYRFCLPKDLRMIEGMGYKLTEDLTDDDLTDLKSYIGIDSDSYYNGFLTSSLYRNNYQPMKLNKTAYGLQVHCADCINLTCQFEHSYTIKPDRNVTTSFKKGTVCLGYFRYPVDDDNEILITDLEEYIDALVHFCLYKYWEYQWNRHTEGAEQRFKYYKNKWGLMRKAAYGELMMPDVHEMETIKNIHNRLVPRGREYFSFFTNLGTEEQISYA